MPSRVSRVARSVHESIAAAQSGKDTVSRRTTSNVGHHPSSPSLRVYGPLPQHARNIESRAKSCPTLGPCAKLLARTLNPSIYRPNCGGSVPSHPQPVRNPMNKAGNSYSSFRIHVALGGRAFGPPLCRGCAPATPPYKTIAHRPCVRIPTVPLQQRGYRKPNTQADCPIVGGNEKLISAALICGQPTMPLPKLAEIHFNQIRRATLVVALPSQNRL